MKSGKIRKSSSSSQNRAHRQSHFKKGNSSVFFSRADEVSSPPFYWSTNIRDLFFYRYDHGTEPFFKKRKGIWLKPNRDKDVLVQAKCDDCRKREKQDSQPQKEGQTRPEVQDRKGGFRKTGRKEYYHLGRRGKWGNHKKGWYLEREYFELFRPVIRAIGQGQAPIGSLGGYNFTEEVHSIMVGWALRATNYYGGKVPMAKGNINAMGFDSPIFMLASLRLVGTMFLRSNVARGGAIGFNALVKQLPKVGQQNVRTLQNWAKSKGFVKGPNTGGPQVWGVYDDAGNFSWRLKIKAQGSMRSGLEAGSQVPRFDARLAPRKYVNPLTGQTGGKAVGTHLPLY